MRSRISVPSILQTIRQWVRLVKWLQDREIFTLAACDSNTLHEYGQHLLTTRKTRSDALHNLIAVTRLWAFDELSARPVGVGKPPWEEVGVAEYLPAATTTGGENATAPLAELTIAPLLTWAMRMVDDLSDDILGGWYERQRILDGKPPAAQPEGRHALHAYLDHLLDSGAPLPIDVRSRPNNIRLATNYMCGLNGATPQQLAGYPGIKEFLAVAEDRPWSCPLNIVITGRVAGQPWRDTLEFYEVPTLWRHLGTAAFIVCAYLTGMRPAEVLGLTTGCCPDPDPDDVVGRHLIHGREYKTAVDENGHHMSGGVDREVPWVAIGPVVKAIRVLEQMVPDGLLFDSRTHDIGHKQSNTGAIVSQAMSKRIDHFVRWANSEATRHSLTNEAIPLDPHGSISGSRFRRSLAWHIARRPNGHVALAIQYGHVRSAIVSAGYASRSRDGIHDLIDIETVRAVADTAAELREDLDKGGGVSGPAARDVIKIAVQAAQFAGTTITAKTARRLTANLDLMVYDNPQALLLCRYKPDRALCQRDGVRDAPKLEACVPGCGNIARTDEHAAQLRARADQLDQHAAHTPEPIGDRLRANAAKLRHYADTHDATRITANDEPTRRAAEETE